MNPQIVQKKADIFDLIAQQDALKAQFNSLEQHKARAVQELTELVAKAKLEKQH